ncbi:MAG: putative TIM-barrel fold metal-dependent hydrolase [Halioglobus sp.]|jgi:predicted TIM-barrel fold metal-dependent hydrolase
MTVKAIDPWVNVSMGAVADADFMKKVKEEYFKGGDDFFKNIEADELIERMDRIGVERAFLTVDPYRPEQRVLDFTTQYPDRFYIAVQPRLQKGMKALWAMEDLARDYPVILARVTPFELDLPPSDPLYYPFYAKCIEMDIPVGVNTGLPGPPVAGDCQNPMYLDRVCLHFPELKLIMQHGADPWWDIAIRLMIKYRNLYLMTSAYSPKYLPESLLHYMNTRGKHKIMFASDHPVLSMDRCISEAQELDLRPGILENYLYNNAHAVLFGERSPRYGEFK